SAWSAEEAEAILRVQKSGKWTMGPETEAFEAEFAEFHSMKHGIMVNSGSSANLVAVAALFHKKDNPLRPGDIALVPALAWSTTYAPLVQYGLDLKLIDCDASWNAAGLPYEGTRLIVGVSILGNPAHLDYWVKVTQSCENAYFIEDNCESL